MILFTFGKINDVDISELADTYIRVFAGPPWFEEYTLDEALEVIGEDSDMDGFAGGTAKKNQNIIGFWWGYNVPKGAAPSVDFAEVNPKLNAADIDPASCFYLNEIDVVEEEQGNGIGTTFAKSIAQATLASQKYTLLFVTKNDNLIKAFERVNSRPLQLFEAKDEGVYWYALNLRGAVEAKLLGSSKLEEFRGDRK